MFRVYNEGTAAIQTNGDTIVIDHPGTNQLLEISTTLATIQGIACDARHVIIWSKKQIHVHKIFESHAELLSELQLSNEVKSASLCKDNLFIVDDKQLVLMTLTGVQRSTLDFSLEESPPLLLSNVNMENNLVTVTGNGVIKVFRAVGDETISINQSHPSTSLRELPCGLGSIGNSIQSVGCNATASLISVASMHNGTPKLFVYNMLRGELTLIHCDGLRYSQSHCWDPAEPRLLACDFKSEIGSSHTVLFLIDEEGGGIYQHETIPHSQSSHLIGVDVPYVVFAQEDDGNVSYETMSDFINLENETPLAHAALLDFAFHSRLGDTDKSFESLEAVTSPQVWANVAPICIKMKRLDLTETCLDHAASAEALAAFKEAKTQPQIEVAFAVAAIQFELYDIAKQLYEECERHDLLDQLSQKLRQRDGALEVAKVGNRIHLDPTQHTRFLDTAVGLLGKYTEKSAVFQQLLQEKRIDELENFVCNQNDPELYSLFGQFNQSSGYYAKACEYFLISGDDLNLVKFHCSQGDFDEAQRVVNEGSNAAAAHYLAKFYTGSMAVKLYSKSGQLSKALALCMTVLDAEQNINQEMSQLLVSVIKDLNEPIPHELLEKIIDRLAQAGETDVVCNVILQHTKDAQTCLNLCSDHNILLSEDIITKLLSLGDNAENSNVPLRDIAQTCTEQGSHRLAFKLYSQLGEDRMAIKCLVKEENANAIIEYANKTDSASVFALAADYLQKIDKFNGEETIYRSIVQFYSMAEKFDKLVTYLISKSQACVEQTGDYDKAMQYLKDASAFSTKLTASASQEIKNLIGERVSTMEWFVFVTESYQTMDRLSLENLCLDLMSSHSDQIIRACDCYALLVRYFFTLDQYQTAYKYLQEMKEIELDPYLYVERDVVKKILSTVENETDGM